MAALPETDGALQRVGLTGAKRHNAMKRVEVVEASLSTKDTKLQPARRATEGQRVMNDVGLRQM